MVGGIFKRSTTEEIVELDLLFVFAVIVVFDRIALSNFCILRVGEGIGVVLPPMSTRSL